MLVALNTHPARSASAYAAGSSDTGNPPGPIIKVLENIYLRGETWLRVQSNPTTGANTIAVKMQNWIHTLNGQGKDAT